MKRGALNWPLVPSRTFSGEYALACPRCRNTDITLTVRPGARGSGPRGRWRLGDPGGREVAICNRCGHSSDAAPKRARKRGR